MRHVKPMGLCALLALALSAALSTSAFAVEGPYYKVATLRLASGSAQVLGVKATQAYVFKITTTKPVTILCTSLVFESGEILGSTGANAGTGQETLRYDGCTAAGNGADCKIKGGGMQSVPLSHTLSYSETGRQGKIQMLLKPASGQTEFLPFEFEECTVENGLERILGSAIAEVLTGLSAVMVGLEPTEREAWELHFPTTPITKTFTESGGTVTEQLAGLEYEGNTASMEGLTEIRLGATIHPNWGFFTT